MNQENVQNLKKVDEFISDALKDSAFKLVYFMNQSERIGHLWTEASVISMNLGYDFKDMVIVLPDGDTVCSKFCITLHEGLGVRYVFMTKEIHRQILGLISGVTFIRDKTYIFGNHVLWDYHYEYHKYKANNASDKLNRKVTYTDFTRHYWETREKYSIPENMQLAIIHARESGWTGDKGRYHDYRNSDILTYAKGVRFLTENNFFVVRIGDSSMTKLPLDSWGDSIIDLPYHPLFKDGDDAKLISNCDLYIGQSSGPVNIADLCERNILCLNEPTQLMTCYYKHSQAWTITLMKHRQAANGLKKSLYDILVDPFFTRSEEWASCGINFINNTEDEIFLAIQDCIKIINKQPNYQERYAKELSTLKEDANLIRKINKLPQLVAAGDKRAQVSAINIISKSESIV